MSDSISSQDHNRNEKLAAFDRLLTIMNELRENCPWDRKQTIESLRHLTIEETFELSDAIIEGDMNEIKKELGDILLHIVFYAKIGSESGSFDIKTIIDSLCDKLILRHPHVYGDIEVNDEETVKQNWEKIKLQEKGIKSVLSGVPKSLPALIKAMRIQEKARGVGFDWDNREQVWQKVNEELEELHEEVEKMNQENHEKSSKEVAVPQNIHEEFGDLLFSMINFARFLNINPEEALERTNKKFIKRFQYMEEQARQNGNKLGEMTLPEMDRYWNEAKKI